MRRSCREVLEVSQRLHVWLSRQASVGEESLTDWLLFELAERLPWVRYGKFSRHEEGKVTGADWEWWFVGSDGSVGIRVQAKRVAEDNDNYPAIAYANRYGLQIDKLRADATRRGLLAMYALYFAGTGGATPLCRGKSAVGEDEGAFLAAANAVHEHHIVFGRDRVEAADLLAIANPLSCWFCCPHVARASRVDPLYRFFREYYPEAFDIEGLPSDIATPEQESFGWHAEPPDYVHAMLQFDEGCTGTVLT